MIGVALTAQGTKLSKGNVSTLEFSQNIMGSAAKGKIDIVKLPYFIIVYDDVIKWKHFPRYWPFVRGIHR